MKIRQILIPIFTVVTIVVNIFIEQIVPGANSVKAISDKYFTNVTPYDLTFVVWGVIFIGLFVYSIYQALPNQRNKKFLDAITIWYLFSCIANMMWLVLWVLDLIVATPIVMIVLLGSLIVLYLNLNLNLPEDEDFTWQDRFFVYLPLSVYFGWITVATIANIASFLVSLGVEELIIEGTMWAAILIIVAALLASFMLVLSKDLPFAIVILWGIFGIANNGDNISPEMGPIQIAFLVSLLMILICAAYAIFVWYQKFREEHTDYF